MFDRESACTEYLMRIMQVVVWFRPYRTMLLRRTRYTYYGVTSQNAQGSQSHGSAYLEDLNRQQGGVMLLI